jgi:hypothetical protein
MTFRLSLQALGLAGWLTASTFAADDVEVLARGPVHEAYAEPSEREPKPTPVIAKEPPKLIEELPPDQKPAGNNVQWIPGYWQWDDDKKDFLWVSGFWRNTPPGRSWVPGSWRKVADGWQWTGGFWTPAQDNTAQIQYLPEPPAPLDVAGPATPAPTETHVYVPGSWVYRERYVWRPGYWTEYRPGWVWVAAHYRWTPAGYVFIDGYWDFPLVDRGVLFAPVYISPVVYTAPAFVYTPTYVVQESCLFGAFFCRRHFGCYYFGDYFAPAYASLGFTAWCGHIGISIGIGTPWYDPLFAYYRCGFRTDPFWGGRGIFDLYAGRYRGDFLRPPTTLVQQTTVINNITKNTTINNVNVNNVQMVSSLNNVARSGRRSFEPVSDPARQQFRQAAASTRDVAARRTTAETELAARPGAGTRTVAPRTTTLTLPQNSVGPKTAGTKAGPVTGGTPPRPTATQIAPPAPKASAIGRTGAGAIPGTPTIDTGVGTGAAVPRANPKPPVMPKGSAGIPNVGSRPLTEPKPLQKAPAGTGSIPKVDLPPRPNPATAPKTSPKVDVPAPRSFSAPAMKPPASHPPVSVPKPPSLPTAPRSLPQSVARPSVTPATGANRLGPAAAGTQRPVPAKKDKK